MISPKPLVTSSVLYSLAGLHVVVVRLEPGAEVPLHQHEHKDEVFDVVCGSGSVCVRGEWVEAQSGSVAVVPRGIVHGLRNTGAHPWIIRETVRQRLYTKGNVLTFLGPGRLKRETRAILLRPCQAFPTAESLPSARPGARPALQQEGRVAVLPGSAGRPDDGGARVPCVYQAVPLPSLPSTAHHLFSVSGLSGSVTVIPAGGSLASGEHALDDLVFDPVRGGGLFVLASWRSSLRPGTVAILPAGCAGTIVSDVQEDLVLRVTRRRRPGQLEIMNMVVRAFLRRTKGV